MYLHEYFLRQCTLNEQEGNPQLEDPIDGKGKTNDDKWDLVIKILEDLSTLITELKPNKFVVYFIDLFCCFIFRFSLYFLDFGFDFSSKDS